MKIFKYSFPLVSEFNLKIPCEIKQFLSVQIQGGKPCLWVLLNDQAPLTEFKFLVVGTGWDINEYQIQQYIGTFQQDEHVWHLFLKHQF